MNLLNYILFSSFHNIFFSGLFWHYTIFSFFFVRQPFCFWLRYKIDCWLLRHNTFIYTPTKKKKYLSHDFLFSFGIGHVCYSGYTKFLLWIFFEILGYLTGISLVVSACTYVHSFYMYLYLFSFSTIQSFIKCCTLIFVSSIVSHDFSFLFYHVYMLYK